MFVGMPNIARYVTVFVEIQLMSTFWHLLPGKEA